MPDSCAAYGCSNERSIQTRSRGITFHRFPKDSSLKREWELAVKREGFVATERSLLCSEHFKADDFDRTGQTVRLRHGVKPSVFNFPSHLQKHVPSRTTQASRKAEESLPVDLPQHFHEVDPQSNVDHNYALPASPAALKTRLGETLARVESLERKERNSMIRERRAKKNVHALLEDLREKNLINEELKDRLDFYSERSALFTKGSGIVVESKRYVRALRRKPVRVLFPENETGKVLKPTPQSEPAEQITKRREAKVTSTTRHHDESDFVKARSHVQSAVKDAPVTVTRDQTDGLRFERAFPGDKRLARLVSVACSRTFREHQGKILLEGRRLICDALDAGANPQMVFFSTVDRLRELPVDKLKRATLVKVKFEDIKIWSDLVAPQGVIAIFSRPDPSRLNFANRAHSVPLSLICDNVRDPGNLGTMLRCAAASGCHNVLLTKGCVDAWEPKVLRAAMGAHFRLPIYPSLNWDDIEKHLPKPVTVHVADSSCDASRETKDLQVPQKPSKPGDYGWVSTRRNHRNTRHEESDSDSDDEGLSLPRVDTKLYHESWAQSPSALVIGGETHGLSLEAVQLAEKTAGHRLFIPVVPDVDSLNSAMAASILLFEGRKQLLKLVQTSGRKRNSKAEQQIS